MFLQMFLTTLILENPRYSYGIITLKPMKPLINDERNQRLPLVIAEEN